MNEEGLIIERVFDAPKQLVWDAFSKPEIMQEWWGPEHFTSPDFKMDFHEGGEYHVSMEGPMPDGAVAKVWSKGMYKKITPLEEIVVSDYFSNEAGDKILPKEAGMDENFPSEMTVIFLFEETEDGKTKLTIKYPKPESKAAQQAMLSSGMNEGWNSSLDKLQKLVESSK